MIILYLRDSPMPKLISSFVVCITPVISDEGSHLFTLLIPIEYFESCESIGTKLFERLLCLIDVSSKPRAKFLLNLFILLCRKSLTKALSVLESFIYIVRTYHLVRYFGNLIIKPTTVFSRLNCSFCEAYTLMDLAQQENL